ncbi:hypothetical protein DL96DRAFT_1638413 [Flagelloscypha sp. PMI_526]|nr:hypothetical protein DL96DRAFT_1638413 [Flagelloscypha sp. PMI_526]
MMKSMVPIYTNKCLCIRSTMATNEATNLVPYTDILRQECPRLRILVLGKSGAGKSALINAVFGVNITSVSERIAGKHDIEKGLTFKSNDRIIIHDSQGFESGNVDKVEDVINFIERRAKMDTLAEQLHGIWVCAEIPFAGSRLFEAGVEKLLHIICGQKSVPVIVVFTKLDLLWEHRAGQLEALLDEKGEDMDDNLFEHELKSVVDNAMQELCIRPLHNLVGPKCQWIATSDKPLYSNTIKGLVDLGLEVTRIEDLWIELAIAQRSYAGASIDASIKIGRKRYWRGIFSDSFPGYNMRSLLTVLQKDIVTVWNMDDPKNHLKQPDFLALITVLVEDLSESTRETTAEYRYTEMAVQAVLENPSSIMVAGPMAIVVLFAEWVHGAYKRTQTSLRCLMGFLVDLTLTLDTLFYLHLSRGRNAVSIGQVNQSLLIYSSRKAPVHASIRAWVDELGALEHLNPNKAIDAITSIIEEYRVKPEQWNIKDNEREETWMNVDVLRRAELGTSEKM